MTMGLPCQRWEKENQKMFTNDLQRSILKNLLRLLFFRFLLPNIENAKTLLLIGFIRLKDSHQRAKSFAVTSVRFNLNAWNMQ